jgi:hypothetical protein
LIGPALIAAALLCCLAAWLIVEDSREAATVLMVGALACALVAGLVWFNPPTVAVVTLT